MNVGLHDVSLGDDDYRIFVLSCNVGLMFVKKNQSAKATDMLI